MPCYRPLNAWRTWQAAEPGGINLTKDPPHGTTEKIQLPCGKCIGCRQAYAQAWALRCHLELSQHNAAAFTTLTYDNDHLPVTLQKRHLQLWLKRLRKHLGSDRPIRFYASGEYGETTQRPHYHAILYGLSKGDDPIIQHTWGQGNTRTYDVTPATIAYVAGYTSKKINDAVVAAQERLDPETGELYTWQPPFTEMSRRPGIGGHARIYTTSWRTYAIHNGHKMAVPRFLHEAWKATATDQQIEQLAAEKQQIILTRHRTEQQLTAAEITAIAKNQQRAHRRTKL